MWKSVVGSLLILVSFVLFYEALTNWDQLATWASFMLGAGSGSCLASGLLLLLWRPSHPATRYKANLPAPWERNRWR